MGRIGAEQFIDSRPVPSAAASQKLPIRAPRHQQLGDAPAAIADGVGERRADGSAEGFEVGTAVDQRDGDVGVVAAGRPVQRRLAATTLGTQTFTVTVTDSAGATVTGTFSLTVTPPPAPSPGGACQTGGKLKEALTGPAINGQTPTGTALANETQLSGCGGFSILSISVKKVNLPKRHPALGHH